MTRLSLTGSTRAIPLFLRESTCVCWRFLFGIQDRAASRTSKARGVLNQNVIDRPRHASIATQTPERTLSGCVAAWVRLLRFQFYPLSLVTYLSGALVAVPSDGRLRATAFAWGYGVVLLLQMVTVVANELFDREPDARNERFGFFNGGSRIIQRGELSVNAVRRALLGLTALLAVLGLSGGLLLGARPGLTLALVGVGAVLGYGYTVPPLRLCYRGLGELTVATTYSYYLFVFGYVVQRGAPPDLVQTTPYCLPLLLAILPAIVTANVPDAPSDAPFGKRTWPVLMGARNALLAALGLAAAAYGAWLWLWWDRLSHPVAALATAAMAIHLLFHAVSTWWRWKTVVHGFATGPLVISALAYVVWFALTPLLLLLGR
jgi:1,4-dihydroxy-2-naphthoate polyprenyltransferase